MTRPAIRLATREDLPIIEACAKDAYAKYVSRIGKEPAPMVADFSLQVKQSRVWVAHRAIAIPEVIQGYVVFYAADNSLQLENIAVFTQYAGQGIGGALVRFVEAEAKRMALSAVELYTNVHMTENLSMYPKLGYVETGRRLEEGFERVFFRKAV